MSETKRETSERASVALSGMLDVTSIEPGAALFWRDRGWIAKPTGEPGRRGRALRFDVLGCIRLKCVQLLAICTNDPRTSFAIVDDAVMPWLRKVDAKWKLDTYPEAKLVAVQGWWLDVTPRDDGTLQGTLRGPTRPAADAAVTIVVDIGDTVAWVCRRFAAVIRGEAVPKASVRRLRNLAG